MLAVNFTPILSLLLAIIPIILIIAILGKFLKGKIFVIALLATLGIGLFAMPFFVGSPVRAAASLEPDSGTLAADLPNYFSAEGLTASTKHWVNVTQGGSTSNAAIITSNADGEITFSITFTQEGQVTVDVRTAAASAVTGQYEVVDLIEMIMPYIIIAVTLGVLFGLIGMVMSMTKFRK